jgi:hypothetical protein
LALSAPLKSGHGKKVRTLKKLSSLKNFVAVVATITALVLAVAAPGVAFAARGYYPYVGSCSDAWVPVPAG